MSLSLTPGFDRPILAIGWVEVDDKVLHRMHMRQRVDANITLRCLRSASSTPADLLRWCASSRGPRCPRGRTGERLVESISLLILKRPSKTIGPQRSRSIENVSRRVFPSTSGSSDRFGSASTRFASIDAGQVLPWHTLELAGRAKRAMRVIPTWRISSAAYQARAAMEDQDVTTQLRQSRASETNRLSRAGTKSA